MNMLTMRIRQVALLASTLVCLGDRARAADGTAQARAVTFSGSASEVITFVVDQAAGQDEGVSLRMDFAPDGAANVPTAEPFAAPASVTFTLTYNNLAIPGFSFNAAQAAAGFSAPATNLPGTSLPVRLDGTKQPGAGKYSITLTFPGAAGANGAGADWKLELGGLPTSPGTRALVAIPLRGTFKSLSVAGPCGAGCVAPAVCQAPCTGCPAGQTTCPTGNGGEPTINICKTKPWVCSPIEFWPPVVVHWPGPPNPPCLSCPQPWQKPVRDGYERVVLEFVPRDAKGLPIDRTQRAALRMNIQGGEPVGEPVDLGNGELAQAIEYPTGSPPRVSATVLGVTTPEIVADPEAGAKAGVYKNATYWLSGVLAVALAALGMLWRQRARG